MDKNFIVFVIVMVSMFGAVGLCMCKSEREILAHRKSTHDLQMKQAETARRWRERQLSKESN